MRHFSVLGIVRILYKTSKVLVLCQVERSNQFQGSKLPIDVTKTRALSHFCNTFLHGNRQGAEWCWVGDPFMNDTEMGEQNVEVCQQIGSKILMMTFWTGELQKDGNAWTNLVLK